MSQLPDPTDPSQAVRSALGGIKEAIKAGREIKETAKEVNQFLDEEAKVRVQWKKRQQEIQRRGDMVWVDARQEWDIIRKMRCTGKFFTFLRVLMILACGHFLHK